MKRVLVIEDRKDKQQMFIQALEGKAVVVCASDEEEARSIFNHDLNFNVIAVDACLNDKDEVDTLELVRYLRSKYSGIIVAISSAERYNLQLIEAGCSHHQKKNDAPSLIVNLLNQNLTYPTILIQQSPTEDILGLLHATLTKKTLKKAMEHLGNLEKIAQSTKNENLSKVLPEIKVFLGKLKGLKVKNPFEKKYTDQIVLIRDTLIPFIED